MSNEIRDAAEAARSALFKLEEALGARVDSNPDLDLRQRIYRARIEVAEVQHAALTRKRPR